MTSWPSGGMQRYRDSLHEVGSTCPHPAMRSSQLQHHQLHPDVLAPAAVHQGLDHPAPATDGSGRAVGVTEAGAGPGVGGLGVGMVAEDIIWEEVFPEAIQEHWG